LEEPIDQERQPDDRRFALEPGQPAARAYERAEVGVELAGAIDPLHRAPAEHVARTNDHRKAELGGNAACLGEAVGDAPRRCTQPELPDQLAEALAILGAIDRIGGRAEDLHTGGGKPACELERRLSTELDDHAPRLLD